MAILPYFGIWNFDFISLNDPQYITGNPQVQAGLTLESVRLAWISERKDVLSTLLMLLSVWAYLAWMKRMTLSTYLLMFISLVRGLMAKPMLVTLPISRQSRL